MQGTALIVRNRTFSYETDMYDNLLAISACLLQD